MPYISFFRKKDGSVPETVVPLKEGQLQFGNSSGCPIHIKSKNGKDMALSLTLMPDGSTYLERFCGKVLINKDFAPDFSKLILLKDKDAFEIEGNSFIYHINEPPPVKSLAEELLEVKEKVTHLEETIVKLNSEVEGSSKHIIRLREELLNMSFRKSDGTTPRSVCPPLEEEEEEQQLKTENEKLKEKLADKEKIRARINTIEASKEIFDFDQEIDALKSIGYTIGNKRKNRTSDNILATKVEILKQEAKKNRAVIRELRISNTSLKNAAEKLKTENNIWKNEIFSGKKSRRID